MKRLTAPQIQIFYNLINCLQGDVDEGSYQVVFQVYSYFTDSIHAVMGVSDYP